MLVRVSCTESVKERAQHSCLSFLTLHPFFKFLLAFSMSLKMTPNPFDFAIERCPKVFDSLLNCRLTAPQNLTEQTHN